MHNETALTNLVFLLPSGNKVPRYPSKIFDFVDGSGLIGRADTCYLVQLFEN